MSMLKNNNALPCQQRLLLTWDFRAAAGSRHKRVGSEISTHELMSFEWTSGMRLLSCDLTATFMENVRATAEETTSCTSKGNFAPFVLEGSLWIVLPPFRNLIRKNLYKRHEQNMRCQALLELCCSQESRQNPSQCAFDKTTMVWLRGSNSWSF